MDLLFFSQYYKTSDVISSIPSNISEVPDGNIVMRDTDPNNAASEVIKIIEGTDTLPLSFVLKHSQLTLAGCSFCMAEEHRFILTLLLK